MKLDLAEIAARCDGQLLGPGESIAQGISTDTRALAPGALFVAIRGERFDGHDFLERAAAGSAVAALIDRPERAQQAIPTICVQDTVVALAALARAERARFRGPVVAITGSNGKTTTKELCADLLAHAGTRVRRTRGNLNNQIGLPCSILALESEDEALVVELGMSHPGEIDALARIASPDVGAITLVAAAHLGPMGSIEAIARAKGELLEHIRPDGTAVLNADDPHVMSQRGRSRARNVGFGLGEQADYRAELLDDPIESGHFRLVAPTFSCEVRLPLPGRHLVMDALCAVAAADATGLLALPHAERRVAEVLAAFTGAPGRLALRTLTDGLRLLDDSYNANPDSVRAAIDTLVRVRGKGHALAVLGDMLELGDDEARLHADTGRAFAQAGVDTLIGVGRLAASAVAGAREAGLARAEIAPDVEAAAARIRQLAEPGDIVLIKGSRGSQMERVASALERMEHLQAPGLEREDGQ